MSKKQANSNKDIMTQRDPWLDYLKAFAIYLVILGHIITNCMIGGSDSRFCGIIYFIHIPLFLVISGILVKDKPMNLVFWKGILSRFVLPYTVWTIILTTFFLGFKHLRNDGFVVNILAYVHNWWYTFFWFIQTYLFVYILWQALKTFDIWKRLGVGSLILVFLNLLIRHENWEAVTLLASLALYTYTLFGAGACIKAYCHPVNKWHIMIALLIFAMCLPFATMSNSYFETTFNDMVETGRYHIFFIRLIAGVGISFALIYSTHKITPPIQFIQNIGQRTLQIYMLQSLLVEAVLPRIIHTPNTLWGYLLAAGIAVLMTCLCSLIIGYTTRMRLWGFLLWGTSKNEK